MIGESYTFLAGIWNPVMFVSRFLRSVPRTKVAIDQMVGRRVISSA